MILSEYQWNELRNAIHKIKYGQIIIRSKSEDRATIEILESKIISDKEDKKK